MLVGKWNKVRITQWWEEFQSCVNELTGGDYLQFTTEIWNSMKEVKLTMEEERKLLGISKEMRKK
eukprot:14276477-Ditylum_brightwellii.AAC.1